MLPKDSCEGHNCQQAIAIRTTRILAQLTYGQCSGNTRPHLVQWSMVVDKRAALSADPMSHLRRHTSSKKGPHFHQLAIWLRRGFIGNLYWATHEDAVRKLEALPLKPHAVNRADGQCGVQSRRHAGRSAVSLEIQQSGFKSSVLKHNWVVDTVRTTIRKLDALREPLVIPGPQSGSSTGSCSRGLRWDGQVAGIDGSPRRRRRRSTGRR